MKLDPTNLQQLAALLEALPLTTHPNHAEAVEMASEVFKAAHDERVEQGRKRMQDQIDDMDPDELAAFHRHND